MSLTPAQWATLQQAWHEVIVNSTSITSLADFQTALDATHPGSGITLATIATGVPNVDSTALAKESIRMWLNDTVKAQWDDEHTPGPPPHFGIDS
jgi:hypothetical protein